MIVGIRTKSGEFVRWTETLVRVGDVPQPTKHLSEAQAALRLCPPAWQAEIVQLVIHWRRP